MRILLLLLICLMWNYGLAHNCLVNDVNVTVDFDFEKFMGTWYEVSRYSDVPPSTKLLADHEHRCVQTGNGSATIYTQGRTSADAEECVALAASNLTTTDTPGKLSHTTEDGTSPFWILETDYTQYAFVYGCYNVSNNGTCSGSRVWIWSRNTSLPQSVQDKMATFNESICVDRGSFETVTFNKSCSVKTHWKLWDGQNCSISNIAVQENFDFYKYYTGSWYEMKWLSSVAYAPETRTQDYQHVYVIREDGNASGYSYGRFPGAFECFYRDSLIQPSSTPGYQTYLPYHQQSSPYLVLETDYSQYAVVYGCYNVSSDGSCNKARSWVWSRTTTLPKHLEYESNVLLQSICVNPSALLRTPQNKSCYAKPEWNLGNKQDCNVSRIATVVKKNFDVSMFTREWYELYSLLKVPRSDNQLELFTNKNGDVTSYSRFREGDKCIYITSMSKKTDSAGKFSSLSKGSIAYLVADTDYETYAVVYTCYKVLSDGSCLYPLGSIWSRTPKLAPQLKYRANSVFQQLCLNPAAMIPRTHVNACPPQQSKPCPTVTSGAAVTFLSSFISVLFIAVWTVRAG